MASDTWSTVAWEVENEGAVTVWHKRGVPYTPNANRLQNIEIWIPAPKDTPQEAPESSSFPISKGVWVIYIHGVKELAAQHSSIFSAVAGIASINYSLSPHPQHPTDPAPPKDASKPLDPSRQAKHPDHIIDVLSGLSYLQSKARFGNNYVLLGHSCGATLAFQVAMSHAKWGPEASSLRVAKPKAIVGLNGLYDMPTLIHEPGDKHAGLKAVYEAFTRLAFGDDEEVWNKISPISVNRWKEEWEEAIRIVFVQSHEDNLVPYWQLVDMRKKLMASKADAVEVKELEASGDHNELWQKGSRLAEIVLEVVRSLS
ncbi:Kynurenine formamidase [Lachnellula suecica]|uniref:Kynurenine formamidase n=1 Tax=Lachnellula suecica TaxID=602035 RepID=A0A8T9C9Y7_9HELO|nr:Kynurenine formamidase [Lachnellula suecica]